MEEIIHDFLERNYYMELSTYSSYFIKDKHSNEKIDLKSLESKLCIIFGYDLDDRNEMLGVFSNWSRKKVSDIHKKINHIKYELYSSGQSDIIPIEEMNAKMKDYEFK